MALNDSHGLCMEDLMTRESTLINVVNRLGPQMKDLENRVWVEL